MNLTLFFDKLNKNSLYLAIFLIPLFFLPFSQSVLDCPKQILLLFLESLSLIGWFGKQVSQKKIILKQNKALYLILGFIFICFSISTIFSLYKEASFLGQPGNYADNLISFFLFLLLVFLLLNSFQDEQEIFFSSFLLLISGAVAAIFCILQLYGIFIFSFDFSQDPSFNTLGTISQAAMFLVILLPISLVFAFRLKKPIFWILFSIFLISVILLDINSAWIILLIIAVILIIFSSVVCKAENRMGLILSSMALLIISTFFLFFPLRFNWFPPLPTQVLPGFVSEINILKGVFSEGVKNFLFGSGPGTFIFDYSKYRPILLNQTPFWATRFSSGSAEFFDWFITKGFLAGISFFFFLGTIIYLGIKMLTKSFLAADTLSIKNEMSLAFLTSTIALLGAGFATPFNFVLWFLFWFIISGLLSLSLRKKEIVIDSQAKRIKISVISLLAIILILISLSLELKNYLAEINYNQGIKSSQKNIDQAIGFIQKATLINPSVDIYWRDISQLYLTKANSISQQNTLSQEEKTKLIQDSISQGIEALNKAVTISPFNVANWNIRGFFYRNLIGIPNAGEIALESYRRASEIEPVSPFSYTEMGRVAILMAQDFNQKQMEKESKEALSEAIKNLEKSIELKSDYAMAHYLLAVAYDQQGKREEAIAKLEAVKPLFPQDIGIIFQLGMLYWEKEDFDKAQAEFERVIELNSNHSNALYMLGLVYDKKGNREKAKEQFEKVATLNPENQEVKKILENLNNGLPILEGVIPSQSQIEELPIKELQTQAQQ